MLNREDICPSMIIVLVAMITPPINWAPIVYQTLFFTMVLMYISLSLFADEKSEAQKCKITCSNIQNGGTQLVNNNMLLQLEQLTSFLRCNLFTTHQWVEVSLCEPMMLKGSGRNTFQTWQLDVFIGFSKWKFVDNLSSVFTGDMLLCSWVKFLG